MTTLAKPRECFLYFPAVSQQEANACVDLGYGHATLEEAEKHLAEIKASADPFYGNQYRVYKCWAERANAAPSSATVAPAAEREQFEEWQSNHQAFNPGEPHAD
jgi:hypothetical protein